MPNVLIEFSHGLGDAVQLTSVLQHLQHFRRDWNIVLATKIGKHTVGRGFCAAVYHDQESQPDKLDFDYVFNLTWDENYRHYGDLPSTKVTQCLRDVFQIEPVKELLNYSLQRTNQDNTITRNYLASIGCEVQPDGRYNAVIIHYQGNTSPTAKNVSHAVIWRLVRHVLERGYVPVILDWDHRSPLPDNQHVFSPGVGPGDIWGNTGTGDAARIAALITHASLFVGIDSGPQKCAGATDTPSIGLWKRLMPVQFFDLCSNFIHLVPRNFRQIPPNNVEHVAAYFESAYPFKTYTSDESLTDVLHETVDQILSALPAKPVPALTQTQHARVFDMQTVSTQLPKKLKSRNFHVEYYQEHKEAGLDYMGHGEWQEVYGKWIVETFDLRDKDILDVGCACGSLATGMQKAGARVHGVDLNNHMIRLGKVKFKDVHLYVCDSVNLHLFGDESFSLVHSNQVAEHWKKELVPFILKEQLRVLRCGGFNFCVMDTEDLFARQRRNNEDEDPTNACIMPLEWWHSQFLAAGYVPAPEKVVNKLKEHPQSYFNKYDWDWVLYQAPYV